MRPTILFMAAFIMTVVSFAQSPPPPRPFIYAAPTSDEIKEFVFDDCGYAISLAGELNINSHPGACAYIGAKRKGSSSTFRVIRFSDEELKKYPPYRVFEMVEATYLTPGRFKVTKKDGIEIFGVKGFDFTFDDGIRHRRLRAFIKDRTLYEFYVDVTNWHILTAHYPDIARAFEAEANRFFNSLRLLKKK